MYILLFILIIIGFYLIDGKWNNTLTTSGKLIFIILFSILVTSYVYKRNQRNNIIEKDIVEFTLKGKKHIADYNNLMLYVEEQEEFLSFNSKNQLDKHIKLLYNEK